MKFRRKKKTNKPETVETEMSFLDHLEALRWHIVRSVVAIAVFSIIAFIFKGFFFDTIIMGPARPTFATYQFMCEMGKRFNLGDDMCMKSIGFTLINTQMAGQFMQHIMISISIGLALSFPYAAWELWRFFSPALRKNERHYARGVVFFASVLFMMGLVFGYYVITPMAVQWLGAYRLSEDIKNMITLDSYLDMVTMMSFASALVFELPMLVYFLSLAGFLTPMLMKRYRKYALVVILVIAAVLTPSPDMTSQMLLAIPFFLLYEASIFVSAMVYRKKLKKQKEINT